MEQRQCVNCRTRFIPLRNPKQHYCSKPKCQLKRQNRYKCQKLKSDPAYKENQQLAQQRWHKTHPEYWKQYRTNKPDYLQANRLAQRVRNKRRVATKATKVTSEMIATIIALTPETTNFLVGYHLVLLGFDVIANRERYSQGKDALLTSPL